MPDIVDLAAEIEDENRARGLARIAADIPAGAPGECDDCGEHMPRLVEGRCAFCRDGRRPPLARFDTLPTPACQEECLPVPTTPAPPTAQTISVPASGAVLAAIKDRAAVSDLPLGRAAISIIQDWLDPADPHPAATAPPAAAQSEWDGTREGAVVFMENVPDAWLIEELVRRYETTVGSDDHAAVIKRAETAEARAEAAEATLASLKTSLKGLVS